jgi:hypothetical protein
MAKAKLPRRRITSAESPESILEGMVACQRCGMFVIGYRLINDDLDQALASAEDGLIHLTWNSAVRKLILKSFGHDIDINLTFFGGICPECHRHFTYRAADGETRKDSFEMATQAG